MFRFYNKQNIKLIIGAGGTVQNGFISTDIDWLDITKSWHWFRNFKRQSVKNIVAEHVFEHLTNKQLVKSLKLIYKYLQPGGRLRLAIPDKNRKDRDYVYSVMPPFDGHKTYMNIYDISKILKKIGFEVIPLEYFDKDGIFVYNTWDDGDGIIRRSFKYDKQKSFKNGKCYYTSLIVDAIKV